MGIRLDKLSKNKRLVRRLLYGKIFHYLLEYYIKYGKWISTYEEFRNYIMNKIKKDFYLVQLSDIENLDEVLRIYWTRYANKKPINLIRLYNLAKSKGYKIKIEYPVIVLGKGRFGKDEIKRYYIDVLLYNPKTKKAFVIEIKTGTKRRKKSSRKQTVNYAKILSQVPFFRDYDIKSYIYWYRYDEFEKV